MGMVTITPARGAEMAKLSRIGKAVVGILLIPVWLILFVGAVFAMSTVWFMEDWSSPERY